jgi:hypothetical protein
MKQQQQNGSAEEDDWQRLQALGTLVLSGGPNETTSPLYQRLLSEEYAPLHAYVRSHYQRQLRQGLARIQYPSLSSTQWDNAGDDGGHNDQNSATLQTAARTLREIAILHEKVMVMARIQVPSNSELQRIVTAWIELINGAHMATQTLLNTTSVESDQATPQSHSDGTQSLRQTKTWLVLVARWNGSSSMTLSHPSWKC